MALRENDLADTMLKKISLDEFEPKTGDEKDVAVIGFYVVQETAGKDLYNFLNGSASEWRDVEVSPNPNEDGYYMVFIEVDRNDKLVNTINTLVGEIERVAGELVWEIKTPYIDDYVPLAEAEDIIQQDADTYKTADEYKEYLMQLNTEDVANVESKDEEIMEFLSKSNLLKVAIEEGHINLRDARGATKLQVVDYGYGPDILDSLSINESAIREDYDLHLFKTLRSMLGEMKAIAIDQYIVIYNPSDKNILVTKPC